MGADRRALYVVPAVAAVVALPAVVAGDLPIGDHVLFIDRAAQMAASAALGLWAARRGSWSTVAVAGALAWCTAWQFVPRLGLAWPSYSLSDMALVLAVVWALLELQAAQTDRLLQLTAMLAVWLWTVDGLIMSPWCGQLAAWDFGTSGTACGAVWGSAASVPAYLTLACWVAMARWTRNA